MTRPQRIIWTVAVAISCIGCDQATKSLAHRTLAASEPVTMLGNVFHFQYTENSGALLGIGSDLPEETRFWLFRVFAGCALLGIVVFTVSSGRLSLLGVVSLSLVVGGGLSNLIDRLTKGGVVIDFVVVALGPFRTAMFNLADLAIVVGLIVLLLSNIPRSFRQSEGTSK